MKKHTSKRLPISVGKEIGKKYDKDQVIILAWNREIGDTWVTTWGKTLEDCSQAAEGGNQLKKVLGWDESQAKAIPAREKNLRKKIIAEVKAKLDALDKDNYVGLDTVAIRDVNDALKELGG